MKVLHREDLHKTLRVTFLGESAVDDGGPWRKYLRLLMALMAEQNHLMHSRFALIVGFVNQHLHVH